MLAFPLYLCFASALGLLLWRRTASRLPHWITLATCGLGLLLTVTAVIQRTPGAEVVTLVRLPWIPTWGAEFHLAADGLSASLLVLTGIASVGGVLFSWNVQDRPGEFFSLYLTLIGAVYGVFLSWDLLLFFVFYELAIIPKYLLIARWGSTRRDYAAMKLALYSFLGSAAVLVGIVALYATSGLNTLDLSALARHSFPPSTQAWAFPVLFAGFAILAGLWPLHTWAPTGHVAAPTAASMLLAGVIMKLGAYGCLRIALPLLPEGARESRFVFGVLAVAGIVWGALVALRQRDFKFVIGYSSVSHMGFVILGLAMATPLALSGAVLQMISHGIIAGLLFAVVGRMVYDRTHTRDLEELGAHRLGKTLPFAAVTFVLAGFASMGVPGFSGFIAELQILLGTWPVSGRLVAVAGFGILLGAAYVLRAVHLGFFRGDDSPPLEALAPPAPITVPEVLGSGLLLVSTVGLGLFPGFVLDWIQPALAGPFFDGLRRVMVP
ncbi:MAG: NADH-quinone oxidoreductase subunit M [Verrucomicrobiales bacterium]|nr:NADH-quinone oxidoreductase subunit M [Verrucomicrobiales bacterium]